MIRASVACVGALLLAGCASNKIDVVESGARPDLRVRGLALAPDDVGGRPVAEKLQAAGLAVRETPGDGYMIELSYSERPQMVGAYAGPRPAADAAPAAWVAPPQERPWWAPRSRQLCTLTARVVEAASGAEAYRVRASVKGRAPDCGEASEGLNTAVAAALAPVPTP
ncbi:hypothetical protein LJR164_000832 [Phenylobacterium sp. LjRoot164]|uniref:hypothetical protein n=1 Tax=unclassified Phenylobacterium TaxID=2640670 RepID=UPI003ECE7D50